MINNLKFTSFNSLNSKPQSLVLPIHDTCSKWSVVTTIFEPSTRRLFSFGRSAFFVWPIGLYVRSRSANKVVDGCNPVRYQDMLSDWRLVVVGDKKGPLNYDILINQLFFFLSANEQIELSKHFSMINNIPWNHFGRKNVGYLYATLHGARMVWDFDDDNGLIHHMISLDLSHYLTKGGEKGSDTAIDSDHSYEVLSYPNSNETSFNPYSLMGAPR